MGWPLNHVWRRECGAFARPSLRKALVRGGQHLGLHELHGDAATLDFAIAWLDAKHFRAALLALKPLA